MAIRKTMLITGSARGIGHGFLSHYAAQDDTVVIAGVRRAPSDNSPDPFADVKLGQNSKILVIEINLPDPESASRAANSIEHEHDIKSLDLVIANAGISKAYTPIFETPIEEFRDHWEVNTLGPLVLFQATWHLLKRSASPKFVALSTIFASIGDMDKYQFPDVAYGSSKAAANFIVRKIHFEHPECSAFSIHPGWVQSDQGNHGAKTFGMEKAPLTIEQSISGMTDKIDNATRERTSGTFQAFDGNNVPW